MSFENIEEVPDKEAYSDLIRYGLEQQQAINTSNEDYETKRHNIREVVKTMNSSFRHLHENVLIEGLRITTEHHPYLPDIPVLFEFVDSNGFGFENIHIEFEDAYELGASRGFVDRAIPLRENIDGDANIYGLRFLVCQVVEVEEPMVLTAPDYSVLNVRQFQHFPIESSELELESDLNMEQESSGGYTEEVLSELCEIGYQRSLSFESKLKDIKDTLDTYGYQHFTLEQRQNVIDCLNNSVDLDPLNSFSVSYYIDEDDRVIKTLESDRNDFMEGEIKEFVQTNYFESWRSENGTEHYESSYGVGILASHRSNKHYVSNIKIPLNQKLKFKYSTPSK